MADDAVSQPARFVLLDVRDSRHSGMKPLDEAKFFTSVRRQFTFLSLTHCITEAYAGDSMTGGNRAYPLVFSHYFALLQPKEHPLYVHHSLQLLYRHAKMSVLAIDPATVLGWCFTDVDPLPGEARIVTIKRMQLSKPTYGLWDGRQYRKDKPSFLQEFFIFIRELITDLMPDWLVYEQPFVSNHNSARLQYGLCAIIELVAAQHGVQIRTLHPSRIKMTALGVGRASKDEILKATQIHVPEINDHNIADAYWLAVAFIREEV